MLGPNFPQNQKLGFEAYLKKLGPGATGRETTGEERREAIGGKSSSKKRENSSTLLVKREMTSKNVVAVSKIEGDKGFRLDKKILLRGDFFCITRFCKIRRVSIKYWVNLNFGE